MNEHEHGLGASGLWRIRQQPPSCVSSLQSSGSMSRKVSIKLQLPKSGVDLISLPSSPSSPTLDFTEDLTRFPSESLHSFSFASQSEEFIHNRQNILKRSMEFLSQKLGLGSKNFGIARAQARANGDEEIQGMLELLVRAQLVETTNMLDSGGQSCRVGPLTGPAFGEDTKNIFDMSFVSKSEDDFVAPHIYDSSPFIEEPMAYSTGTGDTKDLSILMTKMDKNSKKPLSKKLTDSRRKSFEQNKTTEKFRTVTRMPSLRRTYTDTAHLSIQNKLLEALAQPYVAEDAFNGQMISNMHPTSLGVSGPYLLGSAVHGHSSRWSPTTQAIFTTESNTPYTILSANDLACLVFGVTEAEVRKMSILEVFQEERRAWLAEKLGSPGKVPVLESQKTLKSHPETRFQCTSKPTCSLLNGRTGVTASLLSKPNSRQIQNQQSKWHPKDGNNPDSEAKNKTIKNGVSHPRNKSRGVLLCGDVVPIQKRNGATGSASLWVKEKRGSLIWVLEEIHEDAVILGLDDDAKVTKINGSSDLIWGESTAQLGMDIGELLPRISRQGIDGKSGALDYAEVIKQKYFTARNSSHVNIPCIVERVPACTDLRISSFPHIAGILVLSAQTLEITSSNSVFSAALFGHESPNGKPITDIIPEFKRILKILIDEDDIQLVDGMVITEHSFRRARAFLALRDRIPNAASYFSRRNGLIAKHRDGSHFVIDAQLRVVKSDSKFQVANGKFLKSEANSDQVKPTELVYALWITYSQHLQVSGPKIDVYSPVTSGVQTPYSQPTPGQTEVINPKSLEPDVEHTIEPPLDSNIISQLKNIGNKLPENLNLPESLDNKSENIIMTDIEPCKPVNKKSINDFIILEEMGQGAYGQVKLARYKKDVNRKMVLKYVTKRRILIDTWTRDRRLGTVPLEIHVLDYLRQDGLQHPNIIEMVDFFEDDTNYYIETVPHGLPGMDLFDYIELRANMGEAECRSIFVQVAQAICHLHIKASVVHRDIKDENVVLDGEGRIKLIDFGSAAYIKNGPFDVFVGTIDYAAPEVLAGKPYRGKEQDVWALGILLYTIVYKENPFYSIDEIMDRDLRVPHVMNEDNLNLIRAMLDRDVDSRVTIEEVLDHPWCKTIDNT